jgi:hypothetical protein
MSPAGGASAGVRADGHESTSKDIEPSGVNIAQRLDEHRSGARQGARDASLVGMEQLVAIAGIGGRWRRSKHAEDDDALSRMNVMDGLVNADHQPPRGCCGTAGSVKERLDPKGKPTSGGLVRIGSEVAPVRRPDPRRGLDDADDTHQPRLLEAGEMKCAVTRNPCQSNIMPAGSCQTDRHVHGEGAEPRPMTNSPRDGGGDECEDDPEKRRRSGGAGEQQTDGEGECAAEPATDA